MAIESASLAQIAHTKRTDAIEAKPALTTKTARLADHTSKANTPSPYNALGSPKPLMTPESAASEMEAGWQDGVSGATKTKTTTGKDYT